MRKPPPLSDPATSYRPPLYANGERRARHGSRACGRRACYNARLGGQAMKPRRTLKSSIAKRSIVIDGSKTSVSLEDQFWEVLREIATERGTTLTGLITGIDR